ncbi:MAG: DUF3240 domain-containing protein [Gammaproteobacteria bacterium]|jgi:hypothetical protein|nr:DUF3240 domain-containing protein [Gammaproteobacteria bacterium]
MNPDTAGFQDVLVVVSVRPALEEPMVDWLLGWRGDTGFSRVVVEEHSAQHEHMTTAELVKGRQRRVQFQIRMPAAELDALLTSAREQFGGADVHYWVLPLLDGGHLGAAPNAT